MEQFMKEEFNYKRFFLLNIKRIWIVLFGMVIGGGLFAGLYLLNKSLTKEEIYRSDAIYSIEFDMNCYNDTILYYNDYTWNDVIDSDIIGGKVAEKLGLNNDDVYATTWVPTMSDTRLIHVYVDGKDASQVKDIQSELNNALVQFGSSAPGFISIEQWSVTEPILKEQELLTKRVTVCGMILGFVLCLLYLLFKNAMDDSIYTLEDAEKYAGVKVAGKYGDKEVVAVVKSLTNSKTTAIALFDDKDNCIDDKAKLWLKECGIDEVCSGEITEELVNRIKSDGNVILLLKYGNNDGMQIYDKVQQLRIVGADIKTAIVFGYDEKFYKSYYKI